MKPIIMYVYKETRCRKRGEFFVGGDGVIIKARYNGDTPDDIYIYHEIAPPEDAQGLVYAFQISDTGRTGLVYLPFPSQPEKRCRWRYEVNGVVWETKTLHTRTEFNKRYMTCSIDMFTPIEGTEE
jgi:hypothetical protein